MSDKKTFSAQEAAKAVLAKTYEILSKSEVLKKYQTENDPKPGVKYGPIETLQKPIERDYDEYEVKKPSFKDSSGKRLEKQISPSKNPKEEAEGNNKPDGMEPRYEFKDKVSKELNKENTAHQMGKAENPDKDADAELGEKVEKDVEEHFKENKEAEAKEGHDLMVKPKDKMEENTESAIIPRLIGSAKLSKFMEHMHSKRKAKEAQSSEAVGRNGPEAPAPKSPEAIPTKK